MPKLSSCNFESELLKARRGVGGIQRLSFMIWGSRRLACVFDIVLSGKVFSSARFGGWCGRFECE